MNTAARKIRTMKLELVRLYTMGGTKKQIAKLEAELNHIELGR